MHNRNYKQRLMMKSWIIRLLLGIGMSGLCLAGESGDRLVRLELDLVDGTCIIGQTAAVMMPVQTSYSKMEVPFTGIRNITVDVDHENAIFEMMNGDTFKGVITSGPIKLITVFGTVSVSIENITALHVLPDTYASTAMRMTNNLVAYYTFDNDGVEGFNDQSGNGMYLTIVGKPIILVEGVSGKAAQFDGSYLQAARNPLAGADEFSFSLWIKTDSPAENYKLAVAARWGGANNASGWVVGTHYSEFWAANNEGSLHNAPAWNRSIQLVAGGWNHLAITCDRQRICEYINGRLSFESPSNGKKTGDGVPMTVGAWMNSFKFHGLMDELRIYRRALTNDEIGALYRISSRHE
jgi:hypothetical protein